MAKLKKPRTYLDHHVIYKSEKHPRAQGDLIAKITKGEHYIISQVQHRIARNNEMIGWCLIFEGLKRIMAARFEKLIKEFTKCKT